MYASEITGNPAVVFNPAPVPKATSAQRSALKELVTAVWSKGLGNTALRIGNGTVVFNDTIYLNTAGHGMN